ncbi:MAG: SDR family NAD(P)-dependent oxidoreductase [Candidatus Colwellbacteria bacterium]|nr:SDR family NAD(P)-dependent oxidoreductase [Candidatus Colwellbacteria bacterium]
MRVVVITGIDKGIGKALAEKFLKEGDFVIGTYHKSIDFKDENLVALSLDLNNPQSISDCVDKIKSLGKKIDILINNAGVLLDEYDATVIVEKLRATLEVNLIGTIDFTERLIPLIARGGHIINITSRAGSLDKTIKGESHFPGYYPSYKMSKAALNMYTATLSKRLKGIVVSSVHPGWVQTDIGGMEATYTCKEVADDIYKFAFSNPETGGFWFKSERMPW